MGSKTGEGAAESRFRLLFLANLCFVLLSCVSVCDSKFLMQKLLFSILVTVPRVDRLEYPDFKPAGDGGGLGELAVPGDRVRLVHQHLLVRVQVVKVETLYILSQAKLPHFEVVPP